MDKMLDQITPVWYIHRITKELETYLYHCPRCQENRVRRHKPYGALQPISAPPSPFHTQTIDFVVGLPPQDGFDAVMTNTDKFSKLVLLIPGKTTWTAQEWAKAYLMAIARADWGVPKVLISDRDPKFLSDFWKEVFARLGVSLLYSTAYHPQTDGQSERTNATMEIAIRYFGVNNWLMSLPELQAYVNNTKSATTQRTPNEVVYGFSINRPVALLADAIPDFNVRVAVQTAADFAAMTAKKYHDLHHEPLFLQPGDWAMLRLHKGYNIPSAVKNPKFQQQYVGPFEILERVGRQAYRLKIPEHYKIHDVISVAHLEPSAPPDADPFRRPRPEQSDSIYVEGDTATSKSWEIERIIDKKITKGGRVRYLIRWTGYGPEFDQWMTVKQLTNAPELIKAWEDAH